MVYQLTKAEGYHLFIHEHAKMKVFLKTITVFFSLLMLLSCKEEAREILVSSVTLDQTSIDIHLGQTYLLTVTVLPDNAIDKTIQWSSSDESVAMVKDGLVTAVKIGQTTIKASCGIKSASCVVNVIPVSVEEISIDISETSLKAGETVTLTATIKPDDATDKTVTWSTSDASVATVDNGVVTAKKVGSATITAKAGEKTATCAVTVVATPVTSVSLNKTSASLKAGETVTLIATIKPDDATDKTVTWTTSDASVATVDNGVVTAKKVGSATITAKAGDKTVTCNITVIQLVTSIKLNKTSLTLIEGEAHELKPSVYPSNANDKSLVWVSSDPSIATVDANGKVTAVSKGETTIKAIANDGSGVYATCWVYVIRKVSSIELNESAISLYPGQTKSIVATVIPSTANNTQLSWASYNPGVATVSDNGVITGIKAGSTTIIAIANDGSGVYAICNVEVMRYVERIDLNPSIIYLDQGDKRQLTATIIPESAGNKTLNWSSSDEWIATVDQNGLVTAVSATGDPAFIYAYASDGSGMRACCTVYVMGAVDLGLSVKWANFNIGASTPTSYGNYYAWGEIETKAEYTWENYKFRSSGNSSNDIKFSKYNESSAFGNYGPIDNKTVLDPEDDVARVVLGNGWRMPTEKEVIELKNNCSWKEMKNGYYVRGLAKGYERYCIFIPKSGYINGKTRENIGSDCYFWSASLFSLMFMGSPTFKPCCGSLVRASENNYLSVGGGDRYLGFPVRPVTD